MDFEDIKKNHGERRWISWEEEGYLISCVEKAKTSNEKLRKAIDAIYDPNCDCYLCVTFREALEE